jgi:hypothetical protein
LSDAIPPLCDGLGAALIFDVLFEDFESHTARRFDEVSGVPEGVFVVAPRLSTIAFEEELG